MTLSGCRRIPLGLCTQVNQMRMSSSWPLKRFEVLAECCCLDGNRFCNEPGRRDYVTGMMWTNKGVKIDNTCGFFLCLNGKAAKEIARHCCTTWASAS